MGKHTLGELQHAIMQVLWACDEATVAEVHEALYDERGLAPTTIATMLRKMEDKGVVTHRVEGRQFVYRPEVSESAVRSSMVGELLDRLFAGDPAALVSHLVADHTIDAARAAGDRRKRKGRATMNTTIITSWLLTYLVHSTILLGAAWLASRLLADRRLALQETLLRTALIGGLLTTTLQVGVGVEPIGGALAIDGLTRPDAATASQGRTRAQPCPREMTASPHRPPLPTSLFQFLPAFLIE